MKDESSFRGKDFLEQIEAGRIHPVLVFGAYNSGKTLFLCSLLNYASRSNLGGIAYKPNSGHLFPKDFPYAAERNKAADEFFYIVRNFGDGRVPTNTNRARPIFALASLESSGPGQTKDTRPSVTLAFMEGNGEWNHFNREKMAYNDSTEEVRTIISDFSKPITVIFVVPSRGGIGAGETSGEIESREFSFDSAKGSMHLYSTLRDADRKKSDNLLLLFTKWDTNWDDNAARLPDAFYVPKVDEIEQRFGSASVMPTFKNLPGTSSNPLKKALMVYSAARIKKVPEHSLTLNSSTITEARFRDDVEIDRTDGRAETTIADFNQKIWGWLYGNATEAIYDKRRALGEEAAERTSFGAKLVDTLFGFR